MPGPARSRRVARDRPPGRDACACPGPRPLIRARAARPRSSLGAHRSRPPPARAPALPWTSIEPPDMPLPTSSPTLPFHDHLTFAQAGAEPVRHDEIALEADAAAGAARQLEEVAQHAVGRRASRTGRRASSLAPRPAQASASTARRSTRASSGFPQPGDECRRSRPASAHDLPEVEVMRAELAAVVAGADRHDARPGRPRRCRRASRPR